VGDVPFDPRSTASPATRLPESHAAEGLARAARAAERLCAELWAALHEELHSTSARGQQIADLAERLAQVCSAVAVLARRSQAAAAEAAAVEPGAAEAFAAPRAPVAESPEPFLAPPATPHEIAVHDARGEGPSAWVQAIGASLERHARDALPFAVLLIEVADVERLARMEPAAELAGLLSRVEAGLRRELRPEDGVTLESRGRWWVTVPQADASGSRMLAERLVDRTRSLAGRRGVPPEISIGVASCPEDGRDAATLAAHADVSLYAARAAGKRRPPG
jgi:GGDEF domain-containing protein